MVFMLKQLKMEKYKNKGVPKTEVLTEQNSF